MIDNPTIFMPIPRHTHQSILTNYPQASGSRTWGLCLNNKRKYGIMATNSGIQMDTDRMLALMSYNRNLAESLASEYLRYMVRVNNHAIHQENDHQDRLGFNCLEERFSVMPGVF